MHAILVHVADSERAEITSAAKARKRKWFKSGHMRVEFAHEA